MDKPYWGGLTGGAKGVKVLGGGRYLYVLQNPDIPPWRIAKYRLLPVPALLPGRNNN
ncbi:MAG: hypothetical protein OXH51_12920 [Gemmatimonadetes bacterium]|nr:hypothetical protein [Gemmatimonadota bacterium]